MRKTVGLWARATPRGMSAGNIFPGHAPVKEQCFHGAAFLRRAGPTVHGHPDRTVSPPPGSMTGVPVEGLYRMKTAPNRHFQDSDPLAIAPKGSDPLFIASSSRFFH